MKNYKRIILALAALALAASCSDYLQTGSNLVRFNAGTGEPGTKTSYSGQQIDGRERVDWNTGDVIQIFCQECPEPVAHLCDYSITGTISTSGYYSLSNIQLRAGDSGLRWADDDDLVHHFYAVTPSNYVNSTVGQHYYGDTGNCDYSATIPASQPPVSVTADANGNYTAAPDMKNLIMVANADYTRNEVVNLDFRPVVTAVDFTIKNGYTDQSAMVLSAIKLRSAQRDIVGRFTEYYGATAASFTSTGKEVTIPFSTPVSVAYGKTLKFTVFMLGEDLNDIDGLTIEFVTDATTSIQARLKTTSGDIEFPRSKKSYVTGLIVPGACVWTISAEPDAVTAWNESSSSIDIGPAQELPVSGPFGGLYLSKGYLEQTAADTYKLTGNDQLEILKYYGEDVTGSVFHYHEWTKIASVAFDGYSVPDLDQWRTLLGFSEDGTTPLRSGATVNGESGKHYAVVTVDLTGSAYESYGFSGNNTINGFLLLPDGANISCSGLAECDSPITFSEVSIAEQNDPAFTLPNVISYDQLLSLCSDEIGCAFFPSAGERYNIEYDASQPYVEAGIVAGYWSSTRLYEDRPGPAYCTDYVTMTASAMFDYPVRMVKE